MDRRNLLIAVAAGLPALMSVPAFAAEDEAARGDDSYATTTLLLGAFSKKMSELAVQKAKNNRVRDFAGYEIAEQTAIAEVLKNKADPAPPALTDKQLEILDKLGKDADAAFERAYVQNQIDGHLQLLTLQKGYLESHGLTTDRGHIARLAETVIDMHLSMLNDLGRVVG